MGISLAGFDVRCLVDTGFSGHLALPESAIDAYGLTYSHGEHVYLADGSGVDLPFYNAVIGWQGYEVEVQVVVTGDKEVLGTGLLAGWELRAQFVEGGRVEVRSIEPD